MLLITLLLSRDLKCENILLDNDNNVKVSDFGFSRRQLTDQLSKTYCGSAAYTAPEILQGIPYKGTQGDIWSLGVILYIIVSSQTLFCCRSWKTVWGLWFRNVIDSEMIKFWLLINFK